MNKAVLAVSFGTSYDEARQRSIEALERHFAACFPAYKIRRAFTSKMILRALSKRGIQIPDTGEALDRLALEGVEEVVVQPTHILAGEEFDKMCAQAARYQKRFAALKIGCPLLQAQDDLTEIRTFFQDKFSHANEEAVVLMGHGTDHEANRTYFDLKKCCEASGQKDLFIATVEARPSLDDVMKELREAGFQKVVLTPLMLVAGDHAQNDMAGDSPSSWKSRLESAGFTVRTVVKGLGEYPEIRRLYEAHLRLTLEELT